MALPQTQPGRGTRTPADDYQTGGVSAGDAMKAARERRRRLRRRALRQGRKNRRIEKPTTPVGGRLPGDVKY